MKVSDADKIEEYVSDLRTFTFPDRKRFTPVDPESVLLSFDPNELFYKLEQLELGTMGKFEFEDGRGVITIDTLHYELGDKKSLAHTISHEIGHFIMHKGILEDEIARTMGNKDLTYKGLNKKMQLEREADYFAAALRVPRDELEEIHRGFFNKQEVGSATENLNAYKKLGNDGTKSLINEWATYWDVSSFSLAIRMKELGILDVWGRSFITYDRKGKVVEGF